MPALTYKQKLFASTAAYRVPQWFKNGFETPTVRLAFAPGYLRP